MELPDWLLEMMQPVEPQGKPSINVYAGKRLEDLDGIPAARIDALNGLDEALEGDAVPAPAPVAPPAAKPVAPSPDRWKEMEAEAKKERERPRPR